MNQSRALVMSFGLLASGCGTWLYAPRTAIGTAGVELAGVTGNFRITKESAPTPFQSKPCDSIDKSAAVEAWPAALAHGAQAVRVTYPGLAEPLYGVLQLCQLYSDSYNPKGPWLREYLVQVPQSYVDATTDGRMSVVFEPYIENSAGSAYAWILWLSRQPIAKAPGG